MAKMGPLIEYAEAMNRLNDEVSQCTARAERNGLTNQEIAEELRRIAKEVEAEKK